MNNSSRADRRNLPASPSQNRTWHSCVIRLLVFQLIAIYLLKLCIDCWILPCGCWFNHCWITPSLRSIVITTTSTLLRATPPLCAALILSPYGVTAFGFSLTSARQLPEFRTKAW